MLPAVSVLENLSLQIHIVIFKVLTVKSLLHLGGTCRAFRDAISEDVWQIVAESKYMESLPLRQWHKRGRHDIMSEHVLRDLGAAAGGWKAFVRARLVPSPVSAVRAPFSFDASQPCVGRYAAEAVFLVDVFSGETHLASNCDHLCRDSSLKVADDDDSEGDEICLDDIGVYSITTTQLLSCDSLTVRVSVAVRGGPICLLDAIELTPQEMQTSRGIDNGLTLGSVRCDDCSWSFQWKTHTPPATFIYWSVPASRTPLLPITLKAGHSQCGYCFRIASADDFVECNRGHCRPIGANHAAHARHYCSVECEILGRSRVKRDRRLCPRP